MCAYQTVMSGAGLERMFIVCYIHFVLFGIKTVRRVKQITIHKRYHGLFYILDTFFKSSVQIKF